MHGCCEACPLMSPISLNHMALLNEAVRRPGKLHTLPTSTSSIECLIGQPILGVLCNKHAVLSDEVTGSCCHHAHHFDQPSTGSCSLAATLSCEPDLKTDGGKMDSRISFKVKRQSTFLRSTSCEQPEFSGILATAGHTSPWRQPLSVQRFFTASC